MPSPKSFWRSFLALLTRDVRGEDASPTTLAAALSEPDVSAPPAADVPPAAVEDKPTEGVPPEAPIAAAQAEASATEVPAAEAPVTEAPVAEAAPTDESTKATPAEVTPAEVASAEEKPAEVAPPDLAAAEVAPAETPSPEPLPAAASTAQPSREVQLEEEVRLLREGLREAQEALATERANTARLEREIQALADQDTLTGLASARRFGDRLTVAIVHAQRHKHKLAVVQLGLDGFKRVNEKLGSSHGDDLLRSVALALESTLRQGDTIARATGDVFTILLPGIKRDEDVTVIADKLRLALRSPFSIGGHDLLVTASLGIALFPDDGPDTETLLQGATVAMKRAKEKGGDSWDVHAPRSRALAAERQATETQLRRALVQGELELYWQPIVECETGTIVSVESLLRWRREHGVEKAADFVSLADVAGLAVPLGQWALRAACVQGRKWQDAGHKDLAVAVNISQRQLAHAALVKLVRRVLDETGLAPSGLELEVRESELMRNPDLAIERLAELRRLGLRIVLDDFGTGESRLAHLYRYPLDAIKIDGAVVSAAVTNRDQEAVISATIALARSRRLKVVAAGVESEAQRVSLVRWQCDRMQGSLCGPPATAAETERLLLRQRQAANEPTESTQQGRRLL
jgi:diguanylate cyclase (GGDEF)-like protein